MADNELPRIICDKCMVDAEAALVVLGEYDKFVLLRCHDTEELLPAARMPGYGSTVDTPEAVLWSSIRRHFLSPVQLQAAEASSVSEMLKKIDAIQLYHRVRRAQGASPTYFDRVDEVMDTLFLFRRDPSIPLPPEPEPEPPPPAPPPVKTRQQLHQEAIEAHKRSKKNYP